MYIQPPTPPPQGDWQIPKNYSGSAFRDAYTPPASEEQNRAGPEGSSSGGTGSQGQFFQARQEHEEPPVPSEEEPVFSQTDRPRAEMHGTGHPGEHGGFLSRIPFLSSFFSQGHGGTLLGSAGPLPDWAVIALLLFLLSDGARADDVTPFLLLLLLWN